MTTLLDTRSVAAPDRSEYWSSGIAEHFFPMRFGSVGTRSFQARLTGARLGPVEVRTISGVAHSVARTRRMIAEADPDRLLLYLLRRGTCRIEQDERACALGPGELALHDTSHPSAFEACAPFDVAVFSLPKWYLDARVRKTALVPRGREVSVRMAVPFLARLVDVAENDALSEAEGEGLSETLRPLLRTLFAEVEDASVSRAETLVTQMRRYALDHLHDPDLGPEHLARAHFVSTRYVHKLFADSGTGVSEWIRTRRMEGAAQELSASDMSIARLAARWGYRDPAAFSRAFRRIHGCSPSEARAELPTDSSALPGPLNAEGIPRRGTAFPRSPICRAR